MSGVSIQCKHCHTPIGMPATPEVTRFMCPGCRREQAYSEYLADEVRVKLASALQARAGLAQAQAQGVVCTQCGGTVSLPEDVTQPQFQCRFCGALLATAQFVSPQLIAGAQLRAKIDRMKDEALGASKSRDRAILIGALVLALVIGGAAIGLSTLHH